MSQIFLEFDLIVRQLEKMKLNYAVCGGLAVGLYGYIRATEDIDFILADNDRNTAKSIMNDLGYTQKEAWNLKDAKSTLLRFVKMKEGDEPFVVDFLIPADDEKNTILRNKVLLKYDDIMINVVSRNDLIKMKQQRMSSKDKIDIEFLRGNPDENLSRDV